MTDADARAAMRERADGVLRLVNADPIGMRASSGPWLRSHVDRLAHDVLALDAEVTALREALAKIAGLRDRWDMAVTADDLDFTTWFWDAVETADAALAAVPAPEEAEDGR